MIMMIHHVSSTPSPLSLLTKLQVIRITIHPMLPSAFIQQEGKETLNKVADADASTSEAKKDGGINPFCSFAKLCDPDLAIARAKASQDHQKHGTQLASALREFVLNFRHPGPGRMWRGGPSRSSCHHLRLSGGSRGSRGVFQKRRFRFYLLYFRVREVPKAGLAR